MLRHVSVHARTIIREQSYAWLKLQNGLSVLVGIDAVNVMAALSARYAAITLTASIPTSTDKPFCSFS